MIRLKKELGICRMTEKLNDIFFKVLITNMKAVAKEWGISHPSIIHLCIIPLYIKKLGLAYWIGTTTSVLPTF